jgi:hypothetical protein
MRDPARIGVLRDRVYGARDYLHDVNLMLKTSLEASTRLRAVLDDSYDSEAVRRFGAISETLSILRRDAIVRLHDHKLELKREMAK